MRLGKACISWLVVTAVMAAAGVFPAAAVAVTIDMVTVGDPGNAADDTGYGAVASAFQIGKYEVTIAQYAEFLNAIAATDTYTLYQPNMAGADVGGILQNGSSGSYTYTVTGPAGTNPPGAQSPGNRPISSISWFAAARFANWLQNGQPTGGQTAGTTETGAYTLNGAVSGPAPAVNPGAQFYVPSVDQWYKAAYYKGGGTNAGYWDYATQSDTIPGNSIGSAANQANRYDSVTGFAVTGTTLRPPNQNFLTDVGAFSGSGSAYGTFDQTGNVHEWMSLPTAAPGNNAAGGGVWRFATTNISTADFFDEIPTNSVSVYAGFRLASPVPVPEPAAIVIVAGGLVIGVTAMARRRRAGWRKGTVQGTTSR